MRRARQLLTASLTQRSRDTYVGSLFQDNRVTDFPNAQEITALIRQSSLEKPEVLALQDRGVKVVSADLNAPENELVELLRGIHTVISAISASDLSAQIPLANAAKVAGVERFLPCCYGTVLPPEGILALRETVCPS